MTNGDGEDWQIPEEEPRRTREEEGSDWSTPEHRPPGGDNYPQTYSGGPPAGGAGAELETNDYIAIIAALIPGLGQLLLGQTVKGLVILGVALVTCFGGGLISVASVVDAYLVASAKKRRQVGEWEFFPDFQETFNL